MPGRNFYLIVLLVLSIFSCSPSAESDSPSPTLSTGVWRATLTLQGQSLPFTFDLKESINSSEDSTDYELFIRNAEERLRVDEIYQEGDSVRIPLHIFDTEIVAKNEGDRLVGYWTKNYEANYVIPFEAQHGQDYRFMPAADETPADMSGKWGVVFADDSLPSIGMFEQEGDRLTGSFLTTTGDYRFLEGNVSGNQMMLSTFDGEHAYLFKARLQEDGMLMGDYWSGMTYHTTWVAERDENLRLPDANSLTYLKEGYDRLEFSFPNLDGERVSLSDPTYRDKVVLVQIFGTWCPNCMDETKFLADWYEENKDRDVEIIGLAYERKDDFEYARGRVQKMVNKLGVGYDFLVAGVSDKEKASETLPMLDRVMSFPTLIYVDREGKVENIHTGFSGPGTGEYYEKFVREFNERMDAMLDQPEPGV